MPFPLLLLIPIGLGAAGVVGGAKGVSDMIDARTVVEEAEQSYSKAVKRTEESVAGVNRRAQKHGRFVMDTHRDVVAPMAEWISLHAGKAGLSEASFTERIEAHLGSRPSGPGVAEVGFKLATGVATAAATGAAAPAALLAAIGLFGTASTGTAIGALSGVAATNASLALLGGGALAAGGGGVAAGELVLGALAPGIGVLMLGGTLFIAGSQSLTKAQEYEAEVKRAAREMKAKRQLHTRIITRIDEVRDVTAALAEKATGAQKELFVLEDFDPGRDAATFALALQLTRAVSLLLSTPILDADTGDINANLNTVLKNARKGL